MWIYRKAYVVQDYLKLKVYAGEYSRILPSWITALLWWRALHNSRKLWAMPCRATQDGQDIVKSSDKTGSTGGGHGNPLQYSWLENSMNSMKRQKGTTLENEPPGWKVSNMLLEKSSGQLLIAPERMRLLWQPRGKKSACSAGAAGDADLIPASGRSPGGGHGNPL